MKHSLRKYPQPFATYDGQLIKTAKVKLVHAVENRSSDCTVDTIPPSSALMLDGMALIQMQKNLPQTFGAYAEDVLNRILGIAKIFKASRVDFISDLYPAVSIKNLEREKRATDGSTTVRIGGASKKMPRQFKKFLSVGKNKEALIEFIFKYV